MPVLVQLGGSLLGWRWRLGRLTVKHNTLFYAFALVIVTMLFIGCIGKTVKEKGSDKVHKVTSKEIVGRIIEIDDHANAVTNIELSQFTGLGWGLGDTFEVEFEGGQTIRCLHVLNYGDVPVGDYLVRFSDSTGLLRIAINEGYLAQALKLKSPSKVVIRRVQISRLDP